MPKLRTQRRIDQPYSPFAGGGVSVSGGGAIATSILAGDGIDVNGQEVSVNVTVARTTRNLVAGDGLTGGGTLAADRTFAVGAGDGISVAADAVAVDATVVRTTRNLVAGAGLTGGGDLSANRTFDIATGDGISVAGDAVAVVAANLVSGDFGLEVVSNDFRVDLATNSGLAFATGLALGTPGAATATSANAVTTSTHTHAVTASADPGTAISLLKTASGGSFQFGSNLLHIDNATKNVGINFTPDGGAALKVVSVNNDDVTVNIKQKSGQTARLWKVESSTGQELIVLDSQGNLQSGNPGFVSGLLGWQISHIGNAEFNNAWIRGELHASIFVVDEFHSSGGTLVISPNGKLENNMTLHTTVGTTLPLDIRSTATVDTDLDVLTTSGTFSGTTLSGRWLTNYIDITDPSAGHALVFSVGDILRVKTLMGNGGIDLYDVWLRVNSYSDQTDYWRYYVSWIQGGAEGITIPAGAGLISYGQQGAGRILLTADQQYAPYMDVFTVGPDPWSGLAGSIIPRTRIGRLDGVGLPGVSGIEQYGMVSSTNLSDATAPYFIASNLQLALYRVDITLHDGVNPTVYLGNSGRVRFGRDVQADATTGFHFDPNTGDLLIGQAAGNYAKWTQATGVLSINGAINITGGVGYANLTDKPTDLAGINSGEGTKLTGIAAGATVGATWGSNVTGQPTNLAGINSSEGTKLTNIEAGATVGAAWGTNVTGRPTELTDGRVATALNSGGTLITRVLPGSNIGTPAGAGLYLGADKMGYYSGSAWRTYMDNTGKFYFAGTGGAAIAWDLTDLYGTDGSTVQWYARASTGKLYAGGGAAFLDSTGVNVLADTIADPYSFTAANAIKFVRSGGQVAGLAVGYYISGSATYGLKALATSPTSENVNMIVGALPLGVVYSPTAAGYARVEMSSPNSGLTTTKIYGYTIELHSTQPGADLSLNGGEVTVGTKLLFATGGKAFAVRTTAF